MKIDLLLRSIYLNLNRLLSSLVNCVVNCLCTLVVVDTLYGNLILASVLSLSYTSNLVISTSLENCVTILNCNLGCLILSIVCLCSSSSLVALLCVNCVLNCCIA